jgi:hypothetical protein
MNSSKLIVNFFSKDILRGSGMISMLVKGLLEQPAEISDTNCIDDVSKTDNLFMNFDII